MSSSINLKKRNIDMNFFKKTGGYITDAAREYISDVMPTTGNMISEARDTVSEVSSKLKTTTQDVLPKIKNIRSQNPIREIYRWYMQKDSEFDDGDVDLGFDTDIDDTEISQIQVSEGEKNSNKVAKSVIESSRQIVESNIVSTANIEDTLEKQTSVIKTGFEKTNETLDKILEVLTKNTSALIDATIAGSNTSSNPNDSMMQRGKFDLSSYKKIVESNFKNTEAYAYLSFLPLIGDYAKNYSPKDAFKSLMDLGISKAAPNLKNNMKVLDDAVSDTLMQSLIRLGNESRKNPYSIIGQIGTVFGIDDRRKDQSTARSTLELKTVPFDSIAHESITNAIPGYLRKILVAVGGEDLVYDYRSRSFKSQKAIKKEFANELASSNSIYQSSNKVRKALGTSDTSNMLYELLLTDIGSRSNANDILESFSNPEVAAKYFKENLTNGVKFNKREQKDFDNFIKGLSSLTGSNNGIIDISLQASKNNVTRNNRAANYIANANAYNVDVSGFTDSVENDKNAILERHGKTKQQSTITSSNPKYMTGTTYTNVALYQIFRRLDEGINVFQVGSKNLIEEPYKKFGNRHLPPPFKYKAIKIKEAKIDKENISDIVNPGNQEDSGPNLLRDQVLEDGTTEDLTTGQKVGRWAKHRGGTLARAVFSGSPDQVRAAFGGIISDVGGVAGDEIKKGLAKVNTSFGNVSGFLKHKMFGSEYSYQDTDEEGNVVTKHIAKNDLGGVFGFIKDEFKESFSNTKNKASNWFKDVKSYFDYGKSDDPEEDKINKKRNKLIFSSIGAFAGAGILGGPIGMLVGALGGNALAAGGFGSKIKKMLFGDGDKKPGIIKTGMDKFIKPIQFQLGKTMNHLSEDLKVNILGPLSDIGFAIKDRMISTIKTPFQKASEFVSDKFKQLGEKFEETFPGITGALNDFKDKIKGKLTDGVMGLLKLPLTLPMALIRGASSVLTGGTGAVLEGIAGKIAGRSGALHDGYDEDGNPIKISSRDAIKQRAEERKAKSKREREYGKYGDYKTWESEQDENNRVRRHKFNRFTAEREMSPEEVAAKEAAARTAENTQEIANATSSLEDAITNEIIPGSSFKTHDQGLHDRLDDIINIIKTGNPGSTKSKKVKAVKAESKDKSSSIDTSVGEFIGSSVSAAASLVATGDDVNSEESRIYGNIIDESVKSSPSKSTISQRLKDLMGIQKKKSDDDTGEKKESSFFSTLKNLFSIGSSSIGETIGKVLPYALAAIGLSNEGIRNAFGSVLETAGKWLGDHLPGMISTSFSWFKENLPGILKTGIEAAEDINRSIENGATGATTVTSEVTGEEGSVMSAEEHHKNKQNVFKSSFLDAVNPLKLGKDALVLNGLRGAVNIGSGIGSLGSKAVGGIASTINNISKIPTAINAYKMGSSLYGKEAGKQFAKTVFKNSTGNVASKVVATKASRTGAIFDKMKEITKSLKGGNAKAGAIGTVFGTIAADITYNTTWNATETWKNKDILGDYGMGVNAGGYMQTNTNVKTISAFGISTVAGIGIGAAIQAATTGGALVAFAAANGWNPVGWATLIIAGILLVTAALAAIINLVAGAVTSKLNKDYSIRSNAAKHKLVAEGKVTYVNGTQNAMYVYCGQESDRVIGLTKGLHIKDPEYVLGEMMKSIRDNLTSAPGAEVLLYDFINNMAVQGVPFACLLAGDSDVTTAIGHHANDNLGDPPSFNKLTMVLKANVEKYKTETFADIAANINRQDPSCTWDEADLKAVYDSGKEVVKELKNAKIINNNGTVKISKFKGSPNSGKNDSGWTALDEITRRHNAYFLTKCLVYINSKIEVNKEGKQWLEAREADVVKLMEGLKDFFVKEAEAKIKEMKASGMSDKEINDEITNMANPKKGAKAKEAGDLVKDDSAAAIAVNNNNIPRDQDEIKNELKLITASYAYSHPDILQEWVNKHDESVTGVKIDDVNKISSWKSHFKTDKYKARMLRGVMKTAAMKFAETQGDIFNLLPRFDWSDSGKIYSPSKEYGNYNADNLGSGFVLRGEWNKNGEGTLSKLWNDANFVDKTPEDVHRILTGSKKDGEGVERDDFSKSGFFGNNNVSSKNGVFGNISEMIANFYSPNFEKVVFSKNNPFKWQNVASNIFRNHPTNLSIGGEIDDESSTGGVSRNINSDNGDALPGGNPLSKPFKVTSPFGTRFLDKGQEFHSGIDIVPTDNSGSAQVRSRFNGIISEVIKDVPDSHTGLGATDRTAGNIVTIDTDDGYRIKNMHLKGGSIPEAIQRGQPVKVGDLIGEMGSTGRSTGPHLHYQIEKGPYFGKDNAINPLDSIKSNAPLANISSNYISSMSSNGSNNENDNKGPLAKFLEILKTLGSKFLNFISGGLFGSSSSSNDSSISASSTYGSNNISGAINIASALAELDIDKPIELKTNSAMNNLSDISAGPAKVIDLKSGIVYNIYWGGKPGKTHTDYSTLTSEDTDKKIAAAISDGGKYPSWDPRPCILKIGKHQIAIATHNFNHGSVIGNANPGPKCPNMPDVNESGKEWPSGGHFCMYYKDSISNANGLSDNARQHQKTVMEAYNMAVNMIKEAKEAKKLAGKVKDGDQRSLYAYLRNKGYTDEAISGILGCWQAESANTAKRIESDYLSKDVNYDAFTNDRNLLDEYTRNVVFAHNKNINKKAYYGNDGHLYPGLGYAQWTGPRGQRLIEFAKSKNMSWTNPALQLEFMDHELKSTHKTAYNKLKAATSPESAVQAWAKYFEGFSADAKRLNAGRAVYNKYKNDPMIQAIVDENVGGSIDEISVPSNISKSNYSSKSSISNSRYKPSSYKLPPTTKYIGGPIDEAPSYTTKTSTTSSTSTYPSTNTNNNELLEVLNQVLFELRSINNNTGVSSDLLEDLNNKDFVDKGLRDSLNSLKSHKKINSSSSGLFNAASRGNTRTIGAMARP